MTISVVQAKMSYQAQNQGNNSAGNSNSNQTANQAQTQNQEQTQNAGESSQIRIRTEEELQEQIQTMQVKYDGFSTDSDQIKSESNILIDEVLTLANKQTDSTTKNQLEKIAQNQANDSNIACQSLEKAEQRSDFARFFVGPNYKQLKEVKRLMEQNRLRIQEMNQIRSQIENKGEQTELQNLIKVLEEQNTNLQNTLNENEDGFSLFGWLAKIIAKYNSL